MRLDGYANDSCSEMVGKTNGSPPAIVTPRSIASINPGAVAWHGLKSLAVEAIPTTGRSKDSRESPVDSRNASRRKRANASSP